MVRPHRVRMMVIVKMDARELGTDLRLAGLDDATPRLQQWGPVYRYCGLWHSFPDLFHRGPVRCIITC